MKKIVFVFTFSLLGILLLAGCTPTTMINDLNVQTKVDQTFTLNLDSNPTTGYQWQLKYDPVYLEMTERLYQEPKTDLVGAGGKDNFTFKALQEGKTEINFSYAKTWEEEPIETKVYEVTIE